MRVTLEALIEAAGDSTKALTACADCGDAVLKVVGEERSILCHECLTKRQVLFATAAQRGFRIGL